MSVRANWFAPSVEGDLSDPFAPAPPRPVQVAGTPIDLSAERAELQQQVVDLVNEEARLFNMGVTCAIRDRQDTSCNACPVSQHAVSTPMSALCRVGRELEVVITTLAANHGQRRQ